MRDPPGVAWWTVGWTERQTFFCFRSRRARSSFYLEGQANSSSEYLFIPVFFYSMDRLYTPGVPKENLLVLVMEARCAGKSDVGEE